MKKVDTNSKRSKKRNTFGNILIVIGVLCIFAAMGFTAYNLLRSENAADSAQEDLNVLSMLISQNAQNVDVPQNTITQYVLSTDKPEVNTGIDVSVPTESVESQVETNISASVPDNTANPADTSTVNQSPDEPSVSSQPVQTENVYSSNSQSAIEKTTDNTASVDMGPSGNEKTNTDSSTTVQTNTDKGNTEVPVDKNNAPSSNVAETSANSSNKPSSTTVSSSTAASTSTGSAATANTCDQTQSGKTSNTSNSSNSSNSNSGKTGLPVDVKPEYDYPEMPVQKVGAREYIGILSIPKINIELPIQSEYSDWAVETAPCLYRGNYFADTMVICAHNFPKHFGKIGELKKGDKVTFTDIMGNKYEYKVKLIETLAPTDVDEMTENDYDLTLFTCTVGGASRVTVRLERIK